MEYFEDWGLFNNYQYCQGVPISRVVHGEKIPEDLICVKCDNLSIKPSCCTVCKSLYCERCTFELPKGKCLLCKKAKISESVPWRILSQLSRYEIVCKNRSQGCQNILSYENLLLHENYCY